MQQRSLVPHFVFVGVSACLLVAAILTRPSALEPVRAQLAGVTANDVTYIETQSKEGIAGFSNDPATIHACINAVQHATGRNDIQQGKGVAMYFYLTSGPGGVQRRRPVWFSSRADAGSDLGSGMQDCLDKFDRTSRVDPPGH